MTGPGFWHQMNEKRNKEEGDVAGPRHGGEDTSLKIKEGAQPEADIPGRVQGRHDQTELSPAKRWGGPGAAARRPKRGQGNQNGLYREGIQGRAVQSLGWRSLG